MVDLILHISLIWNSHEHSNEIGTISDALIKESKSVVVSYRLRQLATCVGKATVLLHITLFQGTILGVMRDNVPSVVYEVCMIV